MEFNSAEDCQEAYESKQGYEIDGRTLALDYASELGEKRDFGGGFRRGGRGGGRGDNA